jgi:hypothetical protein
VSLLWDFSWESTVGIDRVWAPPHTATYLTVALAGMTALGLMVSTTRSTAARHAAVWLGPLGAPLGAWLAVWGALAFPVAILFDRWWQSAYGLAAGIWHPPQIVKAVAIFAVVAGAWLLCLRWQNQAGRAPDHHATLWRARLWSHVPAVAFAAGGGLVLLLIAVVSVTALYPNRQHSATFYLLACGTFPIVLAALAAAGRLRWPATVASVVYMALTGLMVWLLPLFPAKPLVAPVYHPLEHLMPPPFPLLLVLPAIALDLLLRILPWPAHRAASWLQAGAAGLAFFVVFLGAQWVFAEFLLGDLADNWFFAGGGRHWPFFLKIDPAARVEFWDTRRDELNFLSALNATGLAVLAARVGLWIGAWMTRVRR